MTDNSSSRLDRLESLAETILTGLVETNKGLSQIREELAETNKGLAETRAIANSNAKSIQALSGEWQQDRKEWQQDREQWEKDRKEWEKDRKGIYQLLGRLSRSMSDFYEVQSDFYLRFDQIDERQARMTEILNSYLPPDNQKE
ncbi:MAG TPA: hypothetical protein DCF68_18575 [Cyanothece sp. UBA12306]|nr:hypothetical protein [Cyanothece sp. UBA12306]